MVALGAPRQLLAAGDRIHMLAVAVIIQEPGMRLSQFDDLILVMPDDVLSPPAKVGGRLDQGVQTIRSQFSLSSAPPRSKSPGELPQPSPLPPRPQKGSETSGRS